MYSQHSKIKNCTMNAQLQLGKYEHAKRFSGSRNVKADSAKAHRGPIANILVTIPVSHSYFTRHHRLVKHTSSRYQTICRTSMSRNITRR